MMCPSQPIPSHCSSKSFQVIPSHTYSKMSSHNITILEFHYFETNVGRAFSEFLNNIPNSSYERLTDDWWHIISIGYIKKLQTDTPNLDRITKKLFKRIMSEFTHDLLTLEQSQQLLNNVILAIKTYHQIIHPISYCYCRDQECDSGCGVQRCGYCIDVCRCDRCF